MDQKQAAVDGIPMRWEESGEGIPVVLIHGIPTSPRLWRHVTPLIQGGRCLAWEMVGYGRSIPEGEGRDISVGRQADHLLAWMREIGVQRAVLVGHDLGGGVAHIAAVRSPQSCLGLLLTNSICYDSWPIPGVKAMRAMGSFLERTPNGAFKAMFGQFLVRGHDSIEVARDSVREHWTPYREHRAAAAFVRQIRSLRTEDTLAVGPKLRELRVPARIVWGAADRFQKVAYGERLAEDLRAPLERIEGGKHFTPEDHPDAVARAINDLVDEVRRARVA